MARERHLATSPPLLAPLPLAALFLCSLVVLAGAYQRMTALGVPEGLTFDEHHFVNAARAYLARTSEGNDHPPLGKLWLMVSMNHFGDSAFAWRLPSALFGLGALPLVGWLGYRVGGGWLTGLLAATLAAADGFLLVYSRTALLDTSLAFFSLLAVALALESVAGTLRRLPSTLLFAAAGLAAGCAAGTKFSGVAALLVVGGLALTRPNWQRWSTSVVLLAGFFLAYFGSWLVGLSLMGKETSVAFAWQETLRLYEHHAALTKMDNIFTSSWSTWLLPLKPIFLSYRGNADFASTISSLGNLAIWWPTSLCCIGLLGWLLYTGARAEYERAGLGLLSVLGGWLAFLLPWVISRRDPYIYHYLPAYYFGVVAWAGVLTRLAKQRPLLLTSYLCMVAIVFGFYIPVWRGKPVTDHGLEARLFLENWR